MKKQQLNFANFLSDERLGQLTERLKTGDELLDIISLGENQHSDLLAWMFDAREGHGQGDEIFRDLLMSAANALQEDGGHLDGRTHTYRFLTTWPIQRIRAASFSSVFSARELSLSRDSRPDLLLIDPQNKFVLVIENKAGARLGELQLSKYHRACEFFDKHWMLKDYDRAFIALNRDLDWVADDKRQPSPYWLTLSYDWLKRAAKRAAMHVNRGNSAASLVVGYCEQQTEWESPAEAEITGLAAALASDYDPEIQYFAELGPKLVDTWLKGVPKKGIDAHLWTFVLQNRLVVSKLVEMQGLPALKRQLFDRTDGLTEEDVEVRRKYLFVLPQGARRMFTDSWPMYFRIKTNDSFASGRRNFSGSFCFNSNHLSAEFDVEDVRNRLLKLLPELGKRKGDGFRQTSLGQDLNFAKALDLIAEWERKITNCLEN